LRFRARQRNAHIRSLLAPRHCVPRNNGAFRFTPCPEYRVSARIGAYYRLVTNAA